MSDRATGWLAVWAILGYALLCMGIVWDLSWEGRPDGAQLASDLDLFIQELKDEVGDRGSVETIYGVGSNDNGLARLGSARTFLQNAAPTDMVGVGGYNSTAGAFVGTVLSTNEPNGSIDQGTGRLWVDADGLDTTIASDDNQLNVWVDTVGFTPVTSTPTQRLGSNLIYNGSFEITDGTGVLASTTVASGWADPNTATFAYDSVNDSTEGDGVAFEVIANGGANEAATQTLAGLKESTVYTLRARVRPVVGTCELLTTGGTVNVTDTSAAASGVFETLEGNFTTTAAPADVVVRLESNVAADECDWDHVTVFEQAAVVAPPGLQWATATQSVSVAVPDAFATMLTVSVTKPSAGYLLLVLADWTQENGGGGGPSEMRVQESCAGGGPTTVIATNYEDRGDTFTNSNYGGGHFLNFSALPGSTCVYTLQAQDSAAGANACVVTSGAQSLCRLSALLIPTR